MKLVIILAMMAIAAMSSTTTTENTKTLLVSSQGDDTTLYSPISMCRTWPTLPRLTISVFATIFGLTMNGYFVATFFIAKEVRKIGNVFLACVGLSDFLITAGVMITSDVVLISGLTLDTTEVCQAMQTLVATSTYCYSIFFSLVALVSWCRVNQTRKIFRKYLPAIVGIICSMVFVFGFSLAFAGTYLGMDYDYCQRRHIGSEYFRLSTGSIHALTCSVTVSILFASFLKLKHRNKRIGRYRRSFQFKTDISLIKLNLTVYLLYVLLWIPYLTIVNFYPNAPNWLYYETAWVAISRSLISSTLYGFCNNIFAKAYSSLFNYCWCKISIKNFRSRQARPGNGNYTRHMGDLRTHILMQPTVNVLGPQQDL